MNIEGVKSGIKNFIHKFNHKSDESVYDQADGKKDLSSRLDQHEFQPNDSSTESATAPRTRGPILSDGTSDAQNLVWENEDASMQDKSYSFDEDTTDADYDVEDDFEFEDDNDTGSGQESRYK